MIKDVHKNYLAIGLKINLSKTKGMPIVTKEAEAFTWVKPFE